MHRGENIFKSFSNTVGPLHTPRQIEYSKARQFCASSKFINFIRKSVFIAISLIRNYRKTLGGHPLHQFTSQMSAIMEVEKREIKIKRHEKEKSTLKNNNVHGKRTRPTSFNVTGVSKFFLPEKRARRNLRIPKFLLGGNISDPLNLNSLQVRSTDSMIHLKR